MTDREVSYDDNITILLPTEMPPLGAIPVYLDFNNNGQIDSFEIKTTANLKGRFKFILPFGTYADLPANC